MPTLTSPLRCCLLQVSSLSFTPTANHFITTSWDNQVRCWDIQAGGSCQPKASISHDQPVLCSGWKEDR